MKNLVKPMLQMKTLSITSSRSTSTQLNRDIFSYKLCQVKSVYSSTIASSNTKSLGNSSFLISTVCKGVVFWPEANLNPLPSILKNLARVLFEPDKDNPGKGNQEHEKILEEQQKQLEKLKKDPGRLSRGQDGEKFPKYKPK